MIRKMAMSLSEFTENQLIEELVRRRNAAEKIDVGDVDNWCDDCGNFVTWNNKLEMPERYNPCKKKHKMSFLMPESHNDPHSGGFYRAVCPDRIEVGK